MFYKSFRLILLILLVIVGVLGPNATTIWDDDKVVIQTGPGIPLGLSFIADRWSDRNLIRYGYAYEQISKRRRMLSPVIQPSSDLDLVISRRKSDNEL